MLKIILLTETAPNAYNFLDILTILTVKGVHHQKSCCMVCGLPKLLSIANAFKFSIHLILSCLSAYLKLVDKCKAVVICRQFVIKSIGHDRKIDTAVIIHILGLLNDSSKSSRTNLLSTSCEYPEKVSAFVASVLQDFSLIFTGLIRKAFVNKIFLLKLTFMNFSKRLQ